MDENKEKKSIKCGPFKSPCQNEAIYGFGLIGAAVYYLQHATNLGDGLLGIVKAIAWPAVMLYKVLGMLGM
ncbi:hypothetical protein A3K01_00860 [candidate division WWE3 bacterium RIFOXYD1_FULL_43_17]|uniref:Uncharacterized protein n=3 Tax=Katanobacteria TaxID=422282 RepID=A0A1F4XFF9_UNCKA|nr:MAG: hypothetical protein UU59_C0001G0004 [candidate division WWE3 bacterium GW2011_GWE1_41_27]KKS60772.1 MAG: hypothetical protein UV26_C0002G0098 [candidate division WWE3 bacterium GW2011_GWF2_42_42]OGC80401.1 MAG: hypothetical protein A3K01_00860 [candidate division WWE3 bacterium RIFOXYD1_FULL_43_17]